jgi:hypothetical protein
MYSIQCTMFLIAGHRFGGKPGARAHFLTSGYASTTTLPNRRWRIGTVVICSRGARDTDPSDVTGHYGLLAGLLEETTWKRMSTDRWKCWISFRKYRIGRAHNSVNQQKHPLSSRK